MQKSTETCLTNSFSVNKKVQPTLILFNFFLRCNKIEIPSKILQPLIHSVFFGKFLLLFFFRHQKLISQKHFHHYFLGDLLICTQDRLVGRQKLIKQQPYSATLAHSLLALLSLKGQLISKANSKLQILTKKPTKIFLYFCPSLQ